MDAGLGRFLHGKRRDIRHYRCRLAPGSYTYVVTVSYGSYGAFLFTVAETGTDSGTVNLADTIQHHWLNV